MVAAIKDRTIGDARIAGDAGSSAPGEQAAVEALFGTGVATAAVDVDDLEARARTLCGVLISSPQFLLSGMVAPDASSIPRLTPDGASYAAICSSLSSAGLTDGLVLTCGDSALSVSEAH